MGRLPDMSGRGVSLIVLAVAVPIIVFTSVVTQTAKIFASKKVLAANAPCLPNAINDPHTGVFSRNFEQIFKGGARESWRIRSRAACLELQGLPGWQAPLSQHFGGLVT
jgi:hypothetical protein